MDISLCNRRNPKLGCKTSGFVRLLSHPQDGWQIVYSHFVILICDDNADDCFFLTRAFARGGINAQLDTAYGGKQAKEYLLGIGPYSNRRLPTLLLLDLKMPGFDGLQVLEWIRSHAALKGIPVIMLSSSELKEDVDRAFELGCNAYIAKPHGQDDMDGLVHGIAAFWLNKAKYPSCCGRSDTFG